MCAALNGLALCGLGAFGAGLIFSVTCSGRSGLHR